MTDFVMQPNVYTGFSILGTANIFKAFHLFYSNITHHKITNFLGPEEVDPNLCPTACQESLQD